MSESLNSDGFVDPWTQMPMEDDLDDADERITIQPIKDKGHQRSDLTGLFWRYLASGSAETPASILDALACDPRAPIRRRTAENRSCPPDALSLLSRDPVPQVRQAVALNPHTPMFLLRKLSRDENVDVRYAIAANPEMPDSILLSLFLDPDPYVADRASQTLAA